MSEKAKKSASTSLFDLIKSLNGNERSYFKLRSEFKNFKGKEKILLLIFNILEGQKTFDDGLAFNESGLNDYKHYVVKKVHLYDAILREMRQYHSASASVDMDIANAIINIRFLLSKSLFTQVKKEIKRIKKISYEFERYTPLLEILSLEIELLTHPDKVEKMDKRISAIRQEAQQVSVLIEKHFDLLDVSGQVKSIVYASTGLRSIMENRPVLYRELLSKPIFEDKSAKELFEIRTEKLILSSYLFDEENREDIYNIDEGLSKALALRKQLHYMFKNFYNEVVGEGKLHLLESLPAQYHYILYKNVVWAGQYDDKVEFREALELVNKANITDEGYRNELSAGTCTMELWVAFYEGDRVACEASLLRHKTFLNKQLDRVDLNKRLALIMLVAFAYLLNDDLKLAERWLHKAVEHSRSGKSVKKDNIACAYLLLLMLYAEQREVRKDFNKLVSEAETFIDSNHWLDTTVSVIIEFVKAYHGTKINERANLLMSLVSDLLEREKSRDNNIFTLFPFTPWLESFLRKKSFAQLIKEKFTRKSL